MWRGVGKEEKEKTQLLPSFFFLFFLFLQGSWLLSHQAHLISNLLNNNNDNGLADHPEEAAAEGKGDAHPHVVSNQL